MTPLANLLARLDALDIRLSVAGENLRCSAPQNRLTPLLTAEIQARKSELMAHLGAHPPATFAQERLWFLDRLEGKPSHYNQAELVLLEGALDCAVLQRAFSRIVERHAILRSNFLNEEGGIRIVERPAAAVTFEEAELESVVAAQQWARDLALKPFDLESDPLLRVGLARLGPERHALAVVMHHIVCDGWSTGVLFRELSMLFANENLPPLSIGFGEAARRERLRRSGAALSDITAWWCATLAEAPAVLEIATDRPASPTRSFAGDRIDFHLSVEETKALEALGRSEGASLYMTVLALYSLLLGRHAGTEDVVIGAPVVDREPASEPLIGHFLNTLALRVRLDGAPTFRELVRRARDIVLEAFDHKDMPFGHLVQALNPERDLSHAPVVQAFLNFHNLQRPKLVLKNLATSFLPGLPVWCDYLTLNLYPQEAPEGQRLSGGLEYNVELFDRATIEALADRFRSLVSAATASPDSRIDALKSETRADRAVLDKLHGARRAEAALSLTAAFHAQVQRSPEAVAIVAGSATRSYRELELLSKSVSRYLVARGIRRGDRVGLALPRGIDLVAGLLGIVRAGATYVPLDPGFPKQRLAMIAKDAGLSLVLVDRDYLAQAQEFGAPCADIADALATKCGAQEAVDVAAQDAAYVLYTSGSTGRPKGVIVSHGALTHLLLEIAPLIGLRPADRFVAVTTISFDIAALELFAPLLMGASVIVADRPATMDGRKLAVLLANSDATVMQATPATWRLLLAAGWRAPAGFRVLCGGEALPTELARTLVAGGAELWNLYGPTETTIWSTAHRVTAADVAKEAASVVPIGQPIGETILRVCDSALRAVPVGVPGELLIGGAGVAMGYNGRADLTAEKFIEVDGTRFYRTGDKARVRADGALLFLGRADEQIKLHGFRIEPAEIETVLMGDPAIRQAVVVRREVQPGDARLVAYLVPQPSAAALPSDDQLRETLGASLPGYMIPSLFVTIESLPLTQNGKIDRRALPDPQQPLKAAGPELLTDTERAVATIWEDVLGRHPVGLNDNFFAIGGHSLLTVAVQHRLEQRFGRKFDVASLFLHPTVAALARFVSGTPDMIKAAPVSEIAGRLHARASAQRQRRRIVEKLADG